MGQSECALPSLDCLPPRSASQSAGHQVLWAGPSWCWAWAWARAGDGSTHKGAVTPTPLLAGSLLALCWREEVVSPHLE